MFNLFALTSNAASRIVRIPMSGLLQAEVTQVFRDQESAFVTRAKSEIEFDGSYKPDFDECLVIQDYDDINGMLEAINSPSTIPEIYPDVQTVMSIVALFCGYQTSGSTTALIQAFDQKRAVAPAGWLAMFFSATHFEKMQNVGLTIDSRLAAVLTGKKLKFFSFYVARQISDLSQNYREATDTDLTDFLAIPLVQCIDQQKFIDNSDTWVRRKVALIRQSGVLDNVPIETMKKVAADFGVQINTSVVDGGHVILLPDLKADLKKLLRFLDEDFYKSSLLSLPYMTNSKTKLSA